jgi:hypothetical protein
MNLNANYFRYTKQPIAYACSTDISIHSECQEILRPLWNSHVCFLFMLSSHLPWFNTRSLPSVFLIKIVHEFLVFLVHATRPNHLIMPDLTNIIIFGGDYELWSFPLGSFSSLLLLPPPLRPNIPLSALFSSTVSVSSCLYHESLQFRSSLTFVSWFLEKCSWIWAPSRKCLGSNLE